MHARVPLDVDLEDKLLYGLTPIRLGYLVVGLLAAFAVWSTHWALLPVRAASALIVAAFGASAAWGKWRGRAVDGWMADAFVYVVANYTLLVRAPHLKWHLRWRR